MIQVLPFNEVSQHMLSNFIKRNEHLLPDPLSQHVIIDDYCQKLLSLGIVFVEMDREGIQGVCMGYMNDMKTYTAHIQVLLVASDHHRQGIGKQLILHFLQDSKSHGMKRVELTCDRCNQKAISFYKGLHFAEAENQHSNPTKLLLNLSI